MSTFGFWRIAARLGWRDLVGGPRLALLTAASVAISVAATATVSGLGAALQQSLRGDLRMWLGGDVSVMTFAAPDHNQQALLDELSRSGADTTTVITAPSNAESEHAADPLGVLVKFVDPAKYPLYGRVELDRGTIREVLNERSAILSTSAMEALKIRAGDEVRIAGERFRVAARVESESDRLAGTPPVLGPHAILSLEALPRTGIGRTALLHYRVLVRVADTRGIVGIRARLERAFPDAEVLDYREPSQQSSDILETTLWFLQAAAWIAVVFGALAAAISMRMHLMRKLDLIVVLRVFGARRSQILAPLLYQMALIVIAGALTGIFLALPVQRGIARSLSDLVPLPRNWLYEPRATFLGAGSALAAIALAVLPQILRACRMKPAAIDRQSAAQLRRSRPLIVTLTTGIAVLVFGIQGSKALKPEISRQVRTPNSGIVVLGVLPAVQREVADFLKRQPHVADVRSLTVTWLRLNAVDGRPIGDHLNQIWLVACEPGESIGRSNLRLDSEIARRLGAQLGSSLNFQGTEHAIDVKVAALAALHPVERTWYGLMFDCGAFSGENVAQHLYARVDAEHLETVLRTLHERFPRVPAGRTRDLFVYMDDASRRGIQAAAALAALIAGATLLLLIAVTASWRSSFRRDIAIYKVLGARRRKLIRMISSQLAKAGLTAACVGAPIGWVASNVVLSLVLQRVIVSVDWLPLILIVPAALVATNVGGWLVSYGLLNTRPLVVLRERS